MKQASAHKKKRAVSNKPSKDEREAHKQALSEWVRFQNLARFYEEEMGMKCEMRILPDRPAVPLFSLEVDGVHLHELWEKDPDKAYVAWLSPPARAEWTESIRLSYLKAQTSLMNSVNADNLETFSNLLMLYGPRLLAKDPLDAGVVLSTLDILWRDLRKPSKQDREELRSYDLTTDTRPGLAEGGGCGG